MKNREEYLTSCFIILLICAIALFVSCGTASDEDGGTIDVNLVENVENTVVSSISLKSSQISIKSDDSDSTTITATVLDNQNAVMEGVTVNFSSQGGELNRSEVVTDENGEAEIIFSSGTEDKSNRIEVISATAGGQTRQIPINITGTTVTVSTDMTNLEIGGDDTAILTINVKDAGLVGINNAEVSVSFNNQVSTGIVTFESISTGETSYNGLLDGIYTDFGELKVKVKGIAVGDVTVTVTSMNATATQTYKIGAPADVFRITDPTDDPCSLKTESEQLTITVNAPTQTRVRFATSMGFWDGGQDISVIKDVSNGSASAILSSSQAGIAVVQVIDPNDSSITDSLKVIITVQPNEASQIALQASASVLAPSIGDINNTVTLTAQVRNIHEAPVGGAPVGFCILEATGGGETIMPAVVYTNDSGSASATFTSGSLSSGAEGVEVEARVLTDGNQPIKDNIFIVIGGIAGSIMIGRSTKINSNEPNTIYYLPMSVVVADTNGNPVYGIQVSLNLWPVMYRVGWIPDDPNSYDADDPDTWNAWDNEDKNKNLILDPGEDLNEDGELTPPNSAAGTVPTTVTTDEYGVANFDLVYLKASAVWIKTEITATTTVYGTETQSTYSFWLPYDEKDEEHLPPSPYDPPVP